MAKGNINYNYLRRKRPNWFVRNWKFIVVWLILILAVAALVGLVVWKFI